jgi:hypothetical protein
MLEIVSYLGNIAKFLYLFILSLFNDAFSETKTT